MTGCDDRVPVGRFVRGVHGRLASGGTVSEQDFETWVVDRIDGEIAILVESEGEIVVEVSARMLGDNAVEGAVLTVPLGLVGEPVWEKAHRDEEAG